MKHISLGIVAFLLVLFNWSCDELGETGEAGLTERTDAYALSAGMESGSGDSGGDGTGGNGEYQAGVITAGEWNDLENWDFWIDLQQNDEFSRALSEWEFSPFDRYSFHVQFQDQSPAADVEIRLKKGESILWQCRTDNRGKAECWADLWDAGINTDGISYQVLLEGQMLQTGDAAPYSQGVNVVNLNRSPATRDDVDVMFVVDATGSMGDELEFLKVELNDVLEKAEAENMALTMRYGAVFYRDQDDAYLTRAHGFHEDVGQLIDFIRDQTANGGGDYPEAVEVALAEAVYQHAWSEEARSRILFLMLDAPPHHETEIVRELHEIVESATEKGIRIIPISASGIDRNTEFLLRFFATSTNGTYTFITDVSGIGNDHLEPTTGNYEDEKLNDLLLRLINAFCE